MKLAASLCCVLCASSISQAQEVASPLQLKLPPGYFVVRASSPEDASRLRENGRSKRAAGAAMIGLGTVFVLTSFVLASLTVMNKLSTDCEDVGQPSDCWLRRNDFNYGSSPSEIAGAAVLGFFGTALIPAGIATYLSGEREVARAWRPSEHVSAAPYVSKDGGGAQLRISF